MPCNLKYFLAKNDTRRHHQPAVADERANQNHRAVRDVEILNESELEYSHVGVLAEAYLLTKDVTHTRNELRITRDKLEDSSWQNSYTEIPLTLHE